MKRQRLLIIMLSAVLIIAAAFTGLYLYLPVYLQRHLIPEMLNDSGISAESVTIRRVSAWGADIGNIKLIGSDDNGVAIGAIQVTYSPLSLLHRSIRTIELIGFSADMMVDHGRICIGGICSSAEKKEVASGQGETDFPDIFLPIQINRVKVRNGRLRLMWRQYKTLIPFDIDLLTKDLNQGKLEGDCSLYPRDNPISMTLKIDTLADRAVLKLRARHLAINRFSDLWGPPPESRIEALADIETHITARLKPPTVEEVQVTAQLTNFLINRKGMVLEALMDRATGAPQPVSMHMTSKGIDQWQLICGPFALKQPAIVQIPAIRADMSLIPEGWRIDARLETTLKEQTLAKAGRLAIDQPLNVLWQLQATQKGDKRIDYHLIGDAGTATPFNLVYQAAGIHGKGIHLEATGWAQQQEVHTMVTARTGSVKIKAAQAELHIPEITLSADTWFTDKFRVKGDLTIAKPAISQDTLSGGASSAKISAAIDMASESGPNVTGTIDVADGYFKDSQQNLKIRGIRIKLPFGFPKSKSPARGIIQASALHWHTYERGSVRGDLLQTNGHIDINAEFTSRLRPGLRINTNGRIGRTDSRLTIDIPTYRPQEAIDLGLLIPSAAGFFFTGSLTGNGDFIIDQNGMKGAAQIQLDNARLFHKDDALSIEGISASLTMPHLPDLRSAPRQPLAAGRIQLGEISAHDFNAFFQIEPPGTFFIEKADVQWCNGSVHTQSIRLEPDRQDIELTLFANQLNLTQVLAQLGVSEGEGEGAVNGRIPVRLRQGMPTFDNGFLYSTPGQGGTIHLRGTESLLQGMPREAPQFIQLDIATEALKDYTYNWAKLSLNSENDILKIGLKLNGKPNQLLPFTYDKETEQFRRIEGDPIADFQEIDFDLNFSSSLGQILQYKGLFKQKR